VDLITYLNAFGAGESEGESTAASPFSVTPPAAPLATDALCSLLAADSALQPKRRASL
jgi:hypothetical protein